MGWQEERRQLAGNEKESTAPFSKLRWVHGTVSQDTLSLYLCHSICLASSSRFTFLQTTAFWQVPLPVRPFLRNQPGQISQTLCCLIMGNSYTLGSCRTCCADRMHPIPGSITRHPGESLKALVFVSRLPGDAAKNIYPYVIMLFHFLDKYRSALAYDPDPPYATSFWAPMNNSKDGFWLIQQRDWIPTMLPLTTASENRLAKYPPGRPCDHVYVYAYRSMATSIFSVAPTSKFSSSAVLKLLGMSSPKLRYQPESTMSLHTSAKRRLSN